ncbi:hypothetical protein M0802_000110 [Mischocyttarus mexicanus]|nr:hypothetical protein M0802_000110 [Mischocyttarus mexicanus]
MKRVEKEKVEVEVVVEEEKEEEVVVVVVEMEKDEEDYKENPITFMIIKELRYYIKSRYFENSPSVPYRFSIFDETRLDKSTGGLVQDDRTEIFSKEKLRKSVGEISKVPPMAVGKGKS